MKKLLYILILESACTWGYSQTKKEPIISMYHGKIEVRLYNQIENNKIYDTYITVASRINNKLNIPLFHGYYNDIYHHDNSTDSLFQQLYDWLEEIEGYAAKYGNEYNAVFLANFCPPYYIIDLPLIYVKNLNCDCNDYATWNLGMIRKFKERIVEYSKIHTMNIVQ